MEVKLIVILADVHVPEHDRGYLSVALQVIDDIRPSEVVLAGDFAEMGSANSHGARGNVIGDIDAARDALSDLRKRAARARTTYLEGNHETMLARFIEAQVPTLAGLSTLNEKLKLDALGIDWVPELEQPISRGMLDVMHGHQLGGAGKYPAAKLVEVYGLPKHTIVCGHFHRPQRVTRPMNGGNATGVVLGCGRTLRPKWLHGKQAGWAHQFAIAAVWPGGASVQTIDVINGECVYAGKLYRGR